MNGLVRGFVLLLAALVVTACSSRSSGFMPRTRIVFSIDLDRAVREGRIDPGEDRSEVVKQTMRLTLARLVRSGIEFQYEELDDDRFSVLLPECPEDVVEEVIALVTERGDLRLRMEVRPSSRYPPWDPARTVARLANPESRPWQGTEEEFDAFKAAEVERWKHARDTSSPYVPSDPRYAVVPRHGTPAVSVDDFAVLEEPADPAYRFDGRIFMKPTIARDPRTDKPIVLYDVRPEYRRAFGAWTEQNIGLPLAIVLNDVLRSAPVVNARLGDSVQISMGAGSEEELEAEAEEFATVLGVGAVRVPPTLVSVQGRDEE